VTAAPIPLKDYGVVIAYGDITKRKVIEKKLKESYDNLERIVQERTKELTEKNKDLETFNRAMVDREMRIIEIKKEVNRLCQELRQAPKYRSDFDDNTSGN